jgi:quinol monooxygenase YgiN
MHIVHISIHVKADKVEEFKAVTLENVRGSLQEAGVARFDLVQETDDPTRFLLIEIYRTAEAAKEHKQTMHYNRWREAAEPLMAEPRTRIVYRNIFPDESGRG